MTASSASHKNRFILAEKSEFIEHVKDLGYSVRTKEHPVGTFHLCFTSADSDGFYGIKVANPKFPSQGFTLNAWVSQELFDTLLMDMKSTTSDIYRLSTAKLTRSFAYFDISDFSAMDAEKQHQGIVFLTRLISKITSEFDQFEYEARMCIGDGYIFVFKEPIHACCFACLLADCMDRGIPQSELGFDINFRIGIHMGPVRCYWDPGMGLSGGWNYVGDAINIGQRIVAMVKDDKLDNAIFISSAIYRHCYQEPSADGELNVWGKILAQTCSNRGTRKDKHSNSWRVYQLNHADSTMKLRGVGLDLYLNWPIAGKS